ncbi:MAG: hypothetical protein J1E80_05220 [Desulfovibrionaceae bacterium]|nr:hypothetical protein [Desulfovibrionaceae bacterium]
MKKILIYTIKNGQFIDSLYHALGKGFNEIGRDVVYCYINEQNFIENLLKLINSEDIDFSIGHNEFGIINANQYDFLKKFYTSREHVSILDDAPYNIVTYKISDIVCPNLLLAYRDRSHYEYLKSISMHYKVLDYFFLPFGALIDKRDDFTENKDIDVIFSGMYYGEAERAWHDHEIEKALVSFLDHIANILEVEAITVDDAVSRTMKDYKLKIDKDFFYPAYGILYQYCKMYRRNKLIETMVNSNIQLTVCSETWKKSIFADKLRYEIANNTQDILNLYRRSKVLLHDMAEFNDGSHCRIGDGTLCNTFIVTEHSKFLKEHFHDSELMFFQWNKLKNLHKTISILCNQYSMLNSFRDSAYKKVCDNFLPKHSAMKILDAITMTRNS